jgi:hypothetical protein
VSSELAAMRRYWLDENNVKPNLTLHRYEVVDKIKVRLDRGHVQGDRVTCAGILAFAARDSLVRNENTLQHYFSACPTL